MFNIRKALTAPILKQTAQRNVYHLSTGLSLLNYALSGDYSYGIESGSVVTVLGAPGSGRSTVGLTLLAEAVQNSAFSRYRLLYNDTEMQNVDIVQYFGSKTAKRIEKISSGVGCFWDELPLISEPFIYVLDSLDGVASECAWKLNNERANEAYNSIRQRNSILVIVSQERQVESKKVSAGGFAFSFYADYSLRTERIGDVLRSVNNRNRVVGTNAAIQVLKTKAHFVDFSIPAPVFVGYGYDNAESLFMFARQKQLVVERNGKFQFSEFGLTGTHKEMLTFFHQYEQLIVRWLINWLGEKR